jgi:WD40 repeat protein
LTPTLAPVFLPAASEGQGHITPAAAAAQLAAQLRGSEIILIQAPQAENGRRNGYDIEQKVKDILARREGQVRSLQRDGPAELFADTFAVEVRPEHKEEVLAELAAIEGADVRSLSRLLELGSRRVAPQPLDADTLQGYAQRLKDGTLESRWTAFSELASMLEAASPAAIAAIPQAVRDELVWPLYSVSADAGNAFNMVQGATRQDLRKSFLDDKANEGGWGKVEDGARQALQHPELQARFMPLRGHFARSLDALDRLGTPRARYMVRQNLPHAEYAGLELIAQPQRAGAHAYQWLADIAASIAEMKEGLLAPEPDPQQERDRSAPQWHGSSRSGGYQHVDGRRQSSHLYFWRPYRQDPGEGRNDITLLMGLPASGVSLVEPLLELLTHFESQWPELQQLHRRKELAREYARVEGNIEYYKKQYEQQGQPLSDEQVAQIRQSMRQDAEEKYEQHSAINGHSVVDKLLYSFTYYDSFTNIPGFDAAAYVASVLAFYRGATERISDRSIVAQLADGALGFLTQFAASDLIQSRPDLRAEATSVWRLLAEKTAAIGVVLNTRMDGVIDPRPETRIEPAVLDAVGGDATVWQLAPSPDGRYIAQATGDRRIRVWDAATRVLLTTIELDDARQLYGDLANSLGVTWDGSRLLVTTLHDEKVDGKSKAYNMIRSFDLGAKPVMTPADAIGEARVDDAYVLRLNAEGPHGRFYASPVELRNEQHHYLGAEVRLIGGDGTDLATIKKAQLLDLQNDRLLASAPGRDTPNLQVWDVSKPSKPQDITPDWLRLKVAEWRERNPPSEYGWWPTLQAKLGSYKGTPALLWVDRGQIHILDLATGASLATLTIPSGWRINPFLTDASGTRLAAIATAPGSFAGPNPERIIAWDLSTGKLVMDHDATYVPTGWLYTRGQSIAHLDFSGSRRLIAAGRRGIQVFELP